MVHGKEIFSHLINIILHPLIGINAIINRGRSIKQWLCKIRTISRNKYVSLITS